MMEEDVKELEEEIKTSSSVVKKIDDTESKVTALYFSGYDKQVSLEEFKQYLLDFS